MYGLLRESNGWRNTPGGRALKAVRETSLAICRSMAEPVVVQWIREPVRPWLAMERELAIKCMGDVVVRVHLTPAVLDALEQSDGKVADTSENALRLWRATDAEAVAQRGGGG